MRLPAPDGCADRKQPRLSCLPAHQGASLPSNLSAQVVLTFHPQYRQLAAETLAIYLHAYLGLSGREAVEVRPRGLAAAQRLCCMAAPPPARRAQLALATRPACARALQGVGEGEVRCRGSRGAAGPWPC